MAAALPGGSNGNGVIGGSLPGVKTRKPACRREMAEKLKTGVPGPAKRQWPESEEIGAANGGIRRHLAASLSGSILKNTARKAIRKPRNNLQ